MSAENEMLVIYTHRDDISFAACERIRTALGRPVEFRLLPVAPPVLPGLTRLRKLIASYDAAADEERDTWASLEVSGADRDRLKNETARIKLRITEKRLAKYASLDGPAILDFAEKGGQ